MSHRKIVITGGPSTGKTSVIDSLTELGYVCFPEISRQVTLEARKLGIEQLFLEDPFLFSEKLLEGRIKQYIEAEKHSNHLVFLDRGIPDVIAYMDYIGDSYPAHFSKACQQNSYDTVFLLPPWQAIYTSDSERYESFEQAIAIHDHLENTYRRFGYNLVEVPTGTVEDRVSFIIKHL